MTHSLQVNLYCDKNNIRKTKLVVVLQLACERQIVKLNLNTFKSSKTDLTWLMKQYILLPINEFNFRFCNPKITG